MTGTPASSMLSLTNLLTQANQFLNTEGLYPDKRTYPEATSFEFMIALYKAGQEPSITRFDQNREEAQWYGKTHEDFEDKNMIV